MITNQLPVKNAAIFVDGQNLYRAAKDAFGYHYPNYDIKLLSEWVCSSLRKPMIYA